MLSAAASGSIKIDRPDFLNEGLIHVDFYVGSCMPVVVARHSVDTKRGRNKHQLVTDECLHFSCGNLQLPTVVCSHSQRNRVTLRVGCVRASDAGGGSRRQPETYGVFPFTRSCPPEASESR